MADMQDARAPEASTSTTAAAAAASNAGDSKKGPPAQSTRKPAKEMSKAERRALQEQQRAAKAAEKGQKEQPKKAAAEIATPTSKGKDAAPAPISTTSSAATKSRVPGETSKQATTDGNEASPLNHFLHLDPPRNSKSLMAKISKDQIHPSVLRLALQYADFKIVGANARCIAMLKAFKDVITSYTVPQGKSLSRHLPAHLSPQITHLVRARPMAVSMGNAIRYLKWEIAQLSPDMPDEEAKELLIERIDHFIRDRIILAGQVIENSARDKIKDGDTILTFARSSLIEGVLLATKRQGKRFSVIVVDARPMLEGRNLLRTLMAAGIPCTYLLLSALGTALPTVSLTLLGTHALLSNGAMYSRAGTATVAMMSKMAGIPVICCCETYKFSDRIMLDSIVGNELGSTASLLPPSTDTVASPNLGVLNFLYDVCRPEDVTAVVTETAVIPVVSVPFVLREHKPISVGGS